MIDSAPTGRISRQLIDSAPTGGISRQLIDSAPTGGMSRLRIAEPGCRLCLGKDGGSKGGRGAPAALL